MLHMISVIFHYAADLIWCLNVHYWPLVIIDHYQIEFPFTLNKNVPQTQKYII